MHAHGARHSEWLQHNIGIYGCIEILRKAYLSLILLVLLLSVCALLLQFGDDANLRRFATLDLKNNAFLVM